MEEKVKVVVGIDPDREKSGVALWRGGDLKFKAMDFPTLVEGLDALAAEHHLGYIDAVVVIEASWLNRKSNYHGKNGRIGEKIAYSVGSNHETGRKIVEMCHQYRIPVVEKRPLKTGHGKINAEEFRMITGIAKRCNQDIRDAILLVRNYLGHL